MNQSIQIIRYSNRIEIHNPGYSLKPQDDWGEPGSMLRNPRISEIFHDTNLAETKGTGIGAMRRLMKEAGLMPPTLSRTMKRISLRQDFCSIISSARRIWSGWLNMPSLAW